MSSIDIRALRERTNPKISQAELAKRIGKDQAQISRYEEDPGSIPFDVIMKILEALGVDPAQAFAEPANESEGIDVGAPHSTLHRDLNLLKEYAYSGKKAVTGLPEGSPTIEQLLALTDFLGRKPNLAAYGPFDSGKSTVLNSLLGTKYLPTKYQPATKVPTYVRHLDDRPLWMQEQVWMLDSQFDPQRWSDEAHCKKSVVIAGGVETLRDYGTHDGRGTSKKEPCYALVFLDAPLLKSCNLIDLPGFENDTEDSNRAEANPVVADLAIYTDSYNGFLSGADLTRLGQIIRSLPVWEKDNDKFPFLGNLFILITHAHPSVVSDEELTGIQNTACSRAWRHLEAILVERAKLSARLIRQEDLMARFFTFYAQSIPRRADFEADLKQRLSVHLPVSWHTKANSEISAFKSNAKGFLQRILSSYQKMLKDLAKTEEELNQAKANEPQRKQKMADARRIVTSKIVDYKQEARDHLDKLFAKSTDTEHLVALIKRRFSDKKDAQENAAAYVFEQIQHGFEKKTTELADRLTKDVDAFLENYSKAQLHVMGENTSSSIPFNAEGAFIGGMIGLAGVGALAAWAATLGNLGAYIIAAKAVGLLSALGVSVTGGTAAAMGLLAAMGGPITVALGIVAVFAILGWSLFGPSWQERLAKKINSEFTKKNIHGRFSAALDQYWDQTMESFKKGADEVETKFQAYLDDLMNLVEDKAAGLRELNERIKRVEDARDFFAGIPWRNAL